MKRIALVLFLAACPKEKSSVPDAAVAAVPVEAAQPAGFTLTPQMLDAYLAYQKAWVGPPGDPARRLDKASREQAALKASGLTDEQLNQIDAMVSAVIARRMVSQLTGNPSFNPDFGGSMAKALNAEQRKHMEDAVAQFKASQQAAKDLTDERKAYGSANIDVLLTKEPELTKMWSEMMGLGAYAAPPPTPGASAADAATP